jgi:hypothetical protein
MVFACCIWLIIADLQILPNCIVALIPANVEVERLRDAGAPTSPADSCSLCLALASTEF